MLESGFAWKDKWSNLPFSETWYNDLVAYFQARLSLLKLSMVNLSTFNFNSGVLSAQLSSIPYSDNPMVAASKFADALIAAINASTMIVPSGAYITSPTPATTFSVPPVVMVMAPTLQAFKYSMISKLAALEYKENSDYPVKVRESILLIQYTISGLNSSTPPQPLIITSGVQ